MNVYKINRFSVQLSVYPTDSIINLSKKNQNWYLITDLEDKTITKLKPLHRKTILPKTIVMPHYLWHLSKK